MSHTSEKVTTNHPKIYIYFDYDHVYQFLEPLRYEHGRVPIDVPKLVYGVLMMSLPYLSLMKNNNIRSYFKQNYWIVHDYMSEDFYKNNYPILGCRNSKAMLDDVIDQIIGVLIDIIAPLELQNSDNLIPYVPTAPSYTGDLELVYTERFVSLTT